MTLAVLAAVVLALVAPPKPAAAAFPGENGRIAFESYQDGPSDIYTMRPDGMDRKNITNDSGRDKNMLTPPMAGRLHTKLTIAIH
jgi:hypothetical protein